MAELLAERDPLSQSGTKVHHDHGVKEQRVQPLRNSMQRQGSHRIRTEFTVVTHAYDSHLTTEDIDIVRTRDPSALRSKFRQGERLGAYMPVCTKMSNLQHNRLAIA